jgi:peptidyl-prolyl cis-trans isomerase C
VRTRLLLSLVVAVLAAAAGCTKEPVKDQAAQAPAAPAPAAGTPAAPGAAPTTPGAPAVKPVPASLPDVIAKVNGEAVTRAELELAIRNIEGRAGQPVPPAQRDRVYRDVLERIIGYHLLVQESRARKVVAAPWEVDQRVAEIKKQFPSEQAFDEMMKQRGLSPDRLRQETGDTMAVNRMLEKEFETAIATSDADVRKFYDDNKARFREPESMRASHILIRADQNADAAAKAKARAQLAGLEAQVKKGADFAALAKQHSQDPGSAQNGGDLGFFTRGQMVPPFEQAAFATKPGQVSGIVETPFGYHLIRVAEQKPGRDLGFDEVKGQIVEYMKQQLREQKSNAFIEQLRAKAKVEVVI